MAYQSKYTYMVWGIHISTLHHMYVFTDKNDFRLPAEWPRWRCGYENAKIPTKDSNLQGHLDLVTGYLLIWKHEVENGEYKPSEWTKEGNKQSIKEVKKS